MMAPVEIDEINETLNTLTIDEKVSLLAGADFWRTKEIQEKGVAAIKTTDGPSGARGGRFHDGCKAAFFPSGVSMAATFDTETLYRSGKAIGQEVLARQASVLLAPTTCIHRSPLGGRNFESYSEDPYLAGKLASSYIKGVQSEQVAATIKHYVANEQETTRFTVNETIDERTLREIYLRPFEIAIKESNPLCLMTSYNIINHEHADSHRFTLKQVLRDEWDYEGLIMSDWGGTNSTVDSILATLDLEMPGPTRFRGDLLVQQAKLRPDVHEAIDNSVRRLLTLISRVGKWKSFIPEKPEEEAQQADQSAQIRSAAADGIVMLKNNGLLPIRPDTRSILIVGPNADQEVAGGGGSANLKAYYMTRPLQSIQERFSDAHVSYKIGSTSYKNTQALSQVRGFKNAAGDACANVTFYNDKNLSQVVDEQSQPDTLVFPVDSLPGILRGTKCAVKLSTIFRPTESGKYTFGLASIGSSILKLNDNIILKVESSSARGELMMTMASTEVKCTVLLEVGREYKLDVFTFSADKINPDAPMPDNEAFSSVPGVRLGCTFEQDPDELIASAVESAKKVDIVVAVVALTNEWESEGHDMQDTNMRLPGLQDRLIAEVARVNKNIIVCNQSGVPLAMPWLADVGAVLQCWYQGMEMGHAIADILSGDINPSGKLPVTFPRKLEDNPSHGNFGHKHAVNYAEGIYVGYRYYDTRKIEPLFPFGFGLSYTTFSYSSLSTSSNVLRKGHNIDVSFAVKNDGHVEGKESYQVYISPVSPSFIDRPQQELVGFGKVALGPGSSKIATILLDARSVTRYDPADGAWIADQGEYSILVGASSRDIRLTGRFKVPESFSIAV